MKTRKILLSGLAGAAVFLAAALTPNPAYAGSSWSVNVGVGLGYPYYYGGYHHYRGHYRHYHGPRYYSSFYYSPRYYYPRPYVREVVYERPAYSTVVYEQPATVVKRTTYTSSTPRVVKKTTYVTENAPASTATYTGPVTPYRSVSTANNNNRPVYVRHFDPGLPNRDGLDVIEAQLRKSSIAFSRSPKVEVGKDSVRPDIAIQGKHGKPSAYIEYWSAEDVRAGEARLRLLEELSQTGDTPVFFIEAGDRAVVGNEASRLAMEIQSPRRAASSAAEFQALEDGQ